MSVRGEIRQVKARWGHFLIGLSVLVIASCTASANQPISDFIGSEPQAKQEAPTPAPAQATSPTKENITFKLGVISDGNLCPIKDQDCAYKEIWFESFTLLASDGNSLYLISIPFPSVERSKDKFESSVKDAEKIIRRSPELNSKGEPVGERALGLFQGKPPSGVPHYKLFWGWGTHYWEIIGEHLEDVLALEGRLKEQGINAVWRWR